MSQPTWTDAAATHRTDEVKNLKKARRKLKKIRDQLIAYDGAFKQSFVEPMHVLDNRLAYALLRKELGAEW